MNHSEKRAKFREAVKPANTPSGPERAPWLKEPEERQIVWFI